MKKNYTFVSGKNYFNETSLKEMTDLLDSGKTISIGIDCIGHTRDAMETANYEEALREKYGEKLVIDRTGWPTTYRIA